MILYYGGCQRVLDMKRTWEEFMASISGLLVPVRRNSRHENGNPKRSRKSGLEATQRLIPGDLSNDAEDV
jgi:hypothetical protein